MSRPATQVDDGAQAGRAHSQLSQINVSISMPDALQMQSVHPTSSSNVSCEAPHSILIVNCELPLPTSRCT
jgi:hypothetical protein